jgi:hypothetical protein
MLEPAVNVALARDPSVLPIRISPSVNVVCPVPPLATARVPARVIVPEVVTGPPEVVSPVVPPDTSTEVTVPVPARVQTLHFQIRLSSEPDCQFHL